MNLAAFVVASTALLIEFYAKKYAQDDLTATLTELAPEFSVPRIRSYDFIVVGGGTAGCVVAGRLSEQFNVLLLESGGTPVPATNVPAYAGHIAFDPHLNDIFRTIPQPEAANRAFAWSAGRMLGGSGSHNHNNHNRGSPSDYENWANLTGDPSWGYAAVLPYFKKYENFIGVLFDEGDEDAYGRDGPLHVDTDITGFVPLWLEAGRELGYETADPNARQRQSFTPVNMMEFRGQKVSAYKGFVAPFEGGARGNLTVLRYSNVDEILIDGGGRAYGVAYTRHGIVQRAYASKEIVVSGGALRSPLLLLKSGIGPQEVLTEAGIPVHANRPGVGRNLRDHIQMTLGPFFVNDTSILPRLRDGDEAELERWHADGGGVVGKTEVGPQAFIVSSVAEAAGQGAWPDIYMGAGLRSNGLGVPDGGVPDFFGMTVGTMRSAQAGTITLNTTAWKEGVRDDRVLAVIDPQLLTQPSDYTILTEAVKLALRVVEETTAFRAVGAVYPPIPIPECLDFSYRSDEYWACYIEHNAMNWHHMVGTCKMGRASDPNAVVDPELRVIGVQGLRVVDASVMPVQTNSNPNGPILMIAEKAADIIKSSHLQTI